MSASSIVVMIIGMILLWGGLGLSIWHAFKSSEQ